MFFRYGGFITTNKTRQACNNIDGPSTGIRKQNWSIPICWAPSEPIVPGVFSSGKRSKWSILGSYCTILYPTSDISTAANQLIRIINDIYHPIPEGHGKISFLCYEWSKTNSLGLINIYHHPISSVPGEIYTVTQGYFNVMRPIPTFPCPRTHPGARWLQWAPAHQSPTQCPPIACRCWICRRCCGAPWAIQMRSCRPLGPR